MLSLFASFQGELLPGYNTTQSELVIPTNLTTNFTIVVELFLPLSSSLGAGPRHPAITYRVTAFYFPQTKPSVDAQRAKVALGAAFGTLGVILLLVVVVRFRTKHRSEGIYEREPFLPGSPRRAISRPPVALAVRTEKVSVR